MAASITFYQSFREYMSDGTIDLDTDSFKVTLHTSTYTPNAGTHTVYADLTNELSTASGYTNGGVREFDERRIVAGVRPVLLHWC